MRRYARKFIFFIFLLSISAPAFAALPSPTGYVNDFAKVLTPRSSAQLENALSSFEMRTGNEVAVVTVASLEGRPIEDYAVDLYQTWGIGKKGKDNGVLILVAPNDRQARIEVGYGLEGDINDAIAGRIIREKMIPAFKEGRYDLGVIAGTQAVLGLIANEGGLDPLKNEPSALKKRTWFHKLGSIFMFLILAYLFIRHPWLFLLVMSGMGRGGRGGGFGGGFGGFGGGLSGGGGASGRW